MKPSNLLLILALLTGQVLADPQLEDFAYRYTLKTPGAGAIYELPLPESVYAKVIQPDLSDIAVFNAAHETVPYALRRAIQPEPETPEPVDLPLFPLSAPRAQLPRSLTLKLLSDFQSTVIRLQQENTHRPDTVTGYLVDTSKLEHPIRTLEINWQQGEERLLTRVRVETSDDLSHWQELVSDAALAQLTYAGNTLTRNTIEIPRKQGKYLKIHWPAGKNGASIRSVRAQFFASDSTPVWQHNRYSGKQADTAQGSGFDYEIPAYLPIRQVRISLEQPNSLLQGTLYSRAAEDRPWHARHSGLYYHLQFPDMQLESPAADIPLTADRYWRIEYDRDRSSPGADIPVLEFGWQADQLVFLARGEAPFTLAYGSARVKTRQAPMSHLLDSVKQALDTLPVVQAGLGAHTQGNSAVLSPQPPPLPWRNWLLWASLVTAVLVLALLAWRLHRQMNTGQG
ncbi:MAG TPA: DUF3999 domain-containing protein [Gammaproteobacteria bacterium]|nr:DUF3999 domain-containing protein [Gammaproteobacteria bacterium]